MALVNGSPSVILSNVVKLINQKVDKQTAPLIEKFTHLLYGNISSLDLVGRNDSDMYGATLSLWSSLNEHKDEAPIIHVFNPSVSKNGWKSSHTIIEVIVKDMPFLVDSIRIALNRLGLSPHLMLNAPLKIIRDKALQVNDLVSIVDNNFKATSEETIFLIEIDRQTNQADLSSIKDELLSVVGDISLAVNDWQPMLTCLNSVISDTKKAKLPGSIQDKEDTLKFLTWMSENHFTLMGYRSYDVKAVKGDISLEANIDSSLGLMKNSKGTKTRLVSSLSETGRETALGQNHLILTKTNSCSRVHRPAQLDYIGVKRFDNKGNVVGEDRFIGLFGSAYYTNSALELPLIKSKVMAVCNACKPAACKMFDFRECDVRGQPWLVHARGCGRQPIRSVGD
jgi:glutamate dehydrogenase